MHWKYCIQSSQAIQRYFPPRFFPTMNVFWSVQLPHQMNIELLWVELFSCSWFWLYLLMPSWCKPSSLWAMSLGDFCLPSYYSQWVCLGIASSPLSLSFSLFCVFEFRFEKVTSLHRIVMNWIKSGRLVGSSVSLKILDKTWWVGLKNIITEGSIMVVASQPCHQEVVGSNSDDKLKRNSDCYDPSL